MLKLVLSFFHQCYITWILLGFSLIDKVVISRSLESLYDADYIYYIVYCITSHSYYHYLTLHFTTLHHNSIILNIYLIKLSEAQHDQTFLQADGGCRPGSLRLRNYSQLRHWLAGTVVVHKYSPSKIY